MSRDSTVYNPLILKKEGEREKIQRVRVLLLGVTQHIFIIYGLTDN